MNTIFPIIVTMLVLSFLTYILNNPKNETSNNNPVIKFPNGYILTFKILSVCMGIISLFFGGITILCLINPERVTFMGGSDNKATFFAIFIMSSVMFLLMIFAYWVLKKKEIIIQDNKVIYKSLFKKTLIFTISDIESVKDSPNNKISLSLKSKQKVSIEYQMENFQTFKDILKSHGIIVPGKELW